MVMVMLMRINPTSPSCHNMPELPTPSRNHIGQPMHPEQGWRIHNEEQKELQQRTTATKMSETPAKVSSCSCGAAATLACCVYMAV